MSRMFPYRIDCHLVRIRSGHIVEGNPAHPVDSYRNSAQKKAARLADLIVSTHNQAVQRGGNQKPNNCIALADPEAACDIGQVLVQAAGLQTLFEVDKEPVRGLEVAHSVALSAVAEVEGLSVREASRLELMMLWQ